MSFMVELGKLDELKVELGKLDELKDEMGKLDGLKDNFKLEDEFIKLDVLLS